MTVETLLFGAAVISMSGAAFSAGYQLWIRRRWPMVTGEIVCYRISRGDGHAGQTFYHPAYRFQTLEGETKIGLSSWGSWRRPWRRGSRVVVRYHPDNPQRTELQCFANEWGIASTLAAIAVGFGAAKYWMLE